MNSHEELPWLRVRTSLGASSLACVLAALVCSPALVEAKDAVPNLGGGLDKVAVPAAAASTQRRAASAAEKSSAAQKASASNELVRPMQFDASGRVLVRVSLDGKVPAANVLKSVEGISSVQVSASDMRYGKGVIEAWVPTGSLKNLARQKGVLAVVPSVPFVTNVGATTSQGVVQHRVDKLPAGVDGSGITVGVLSDSYNVNGGDITAEDDIASGDLPGAGNPNGNTQAVVVLEENDGGIDEGRGMMQIIHDLAPKARLGFATADFGQVNFANNIRALAGLEDAPNAIPGFKANVIVDDILYPDEPMFQDGIVAQAVDEVAGKGVAYFSSAGNRPATEAYDSKPRIVPGAPASWANTNLNFADVDPALYAGGFHDFDPGNAVDIAQTINFAPGNRLSFQWNEPFDPIPPTPSGPPLAVGVSTVPPGGIDFFTFNGTAGQIVQIFLDADDSTTGVPIPDIVFAVFDPAGNLIQFVDTGTNPEFLTLQLQATGEYTVLVDAFEEDQFGDYFFIVQPVTIVEQVLTDFNLLFFEEDGTFLGAGDEQNLFTNRPLEFVGLPGRTLQMVISRANTPNSANRNVADRIRYVGFDGVEPQEYYSYLDPVTYGHNSARGAMSVAAYPFFPPFVPESFTSPGPSTIYFDTNNRRFKSPEIRQKPDLAAMDGANTTFFTEDTDVDDDTFPNFFGTSAAAPHAAAIAALVLDAAGGPGKVRPNQMRKILQESAFRHDLDPYFSWGVAFSGANLLTVNALGDGNAISQFEPNFFTLSHVGVRRLQSFSVNGSDANPTQTPKGILFDERSTPPEQPPGQPFVIGRTVGLTPADISASFSLPGSPPAVAGQWKQLDLTFGAGAFRSGDLLSFGVDRDEADFAGPAGAISGNSADLLGGGILIPSGQFVDGGASFFGRFEGGGTFRGEFNNLIGKGYSQLDGYGFVNAEAAVKSVLKKN
jgi:hypothetical protein